MTPPTAYMICTSPRSGSTLLCELLKATGGAGNPGSHFHTPSLARWRESYGLEDQRFDSETEVLSAVFTRACARGRGDTGIFGLRMQRGSFGFFLEQLTRLHAQQPSDRARIEAAFGPTLFLHLTRANKLDQAISRLIAEQSGLWHRRADGTELERTAPPAEPTYNRAAIARHLTEFKDMDEAWGAWFAEQKIIPLTITYDDLSRDPKGAVARILTALHLDPDLADKITPPTTKLADTRNREWAERFRAESAAP